jgi:polysaccharide chain length determinant protein (PEP-CTERM system associated)
VSKLQIGEYVDLLRRRITWIAMIFIGISVCAGMVAVRLPNVFRAETVILVDPQKVPDSYVATTVSTSISDRLSTIRQEVMSPTRLSQLITEMKLYPELRGKIPLQDLIVRMQKATTIEVIEAGGQRLSAFRIAFSGANSQQVAEVANRLASLFIEQNLQARKKQFNGTAQFLDSELQDTKSQLDEKGRQLQDIKSRFLMVLPESKQYHLEAMNTLRDQLRSSQEQVNRDRQSIVYLESMAKVSAPTVDLDRDSGAPALPYQGQIQKLEGQLKELEVRYGPNFPDVKKLRTEIMRLKAKAETDKPTIAAREPQTELAQTESSQKSIHNPVLEAEVNKLEQEISAQTKNQSDLQSQIQYHTSQLQQVPIFEQQISGLMRDYDALQTHYNQLQEKKLSAEMASELETKEAGERFVILDQAVPPVRPYAPNRPYIIGIGLALGLFGGIGAAVFLEMSDESVRHERDAGHIFGKPVLAGIPLIISDQQRAQKRWRTGGLMVATAIGAAVVGLMISRILIG